MSHHLQDRFTCECFLLLALLAPVWELGNDGTEGRSKERGAAHVEVGCMENWNEAACVTCMQCEYVHAYSLSQAWNVWQWLHQPVPSAGTTVCLTYWGIAIQSRSIIINPTQSIPKLTCLPLELVVLRNEVLLHPVNRTQVRETTERFCSTYTAMVPLVQQLCAHSPVIVWYVSTCGSEPTAVGLVVSPIYIERFGW